MAALKRLFRVLFDRAEAVFDFAFGQQLNPFVWLGALGWYFFWIVFGSGIYLYVFFDTGITNAYASVEYITNDQWYRQRETWWHAVSDVSPSGGAPSNSSDKPEGNDG